MKENKFSREQILAGLNGHPYYEKISLYFGRDFGEQTIKEIKVKFLFDKLIQQKFLREKATPYIWAMIGIPVLNKYGYYISIAVFMVFSLWVMDQLVIKAPHFFILRNSPFSFLKDFNWAVSKSGLARMPIKENTGFYSSLFLWAMSMIVSTLIYL